MDLLERAHYLDQLTELWHSATAGQGRTVLISGEAGIGKTALMEKFVSQQRDSARLLWGACEAFFTPRPLGPLYDIATQAQGSLSTLMSCDASRPLVFSALLGELQQSPLPNIVVFEDVHWADEATLDLIKFLGRRVPHLPVLFLVTYRDDELSRDHPLWSVIGDLPGNAVARLKLVPLSEQAVICLANQAQRSTEQLYAITGGNPFFVTEVLTNDTPGVPLVVRDAILARIARISPAARTLLELTSIVPTRTERWLLDAVLGPAVETIEECLNSGMLSLDQTTVSFRHELARQAVASTLSPLRRQALHAQVLQAFVSRKEASSQAARLVHHALGAHDGELVARYAPLAAQQASAQGAHREAAAQYATALLEISRFSPERQAELLEGRAYEAYLAGLIEEALEARLAALRMWRQLARAERVGHTLRWLARLSWFLGQSHAAEQYAAEAVQLLETLPPGVELAMAYSSRAQLAMVAENTVAAVQWGERAIALAKSLGDDETLVHALNNVGAARLVAQDQQGRTYLEQSLQLALEGGWKEHAGRAYTNLSCWAVMTRNYPLAERFLQEGMAYCSEHDIDPCGIYMAGWLARARFEQGNWDEATRMALGVLNHTRLPTAARIPAMTVLGWVQARRGEAGSKAVLDEAHTLALGTGELQRIAPVAVARAEAAWLQGDLEQCLAEARLGYELALKHPDPWKLGELSIWMWRAGELTGAPGPIAEPFAQEMKGNWRKAADLWEQIGCPYEQAMALASGDGEAMRHALLLFEQLGAQPAVAMVKQRLRQLGIGGIPRGPRPSTRTHQAGLTLRQREVLALLVEGFSNAEIASRLFTSPKTVEHHVSAILAKLGVHSRAQAIRAAYHLELLPTTADQTA